MDINRLLKPKKVAVVGASEKEGFASDTCKNILQYTKNLDSVYFVNPKRDTVFDRKCYPSLSDIPEQIDLVIICTPQKVVPSIIEEAGRNKCGGAVIFASGYSETGEEGAKAQEELIQVCKDNDIAMMGPNCAGFANYNGDVFSFAFLSEKRERKGNIGMISQSGQVCLSALDKLGMGFSYLISSGNSASISTEEYLEFLAKDEDTKVIAAYIEGVRNPQVFANALKIAAENKKPVIILKTGRSNKAIALASSHTGSIAGSDAAFSAVMEKYGAIRVDDIQELLGTAQMFSKLTLYPTQKKWAIVNVSGGEAGISADIAYLKNLELADISEQTKATLNTIVPDYCTPNNPLDLTATLAYIPELFAKALSTLMKDSEVGGLIIGYTITSQIIDQTIPCMIEGLELFKKEGYDKPILWLPFVEHTPNQECLEKLLALNIPVLSSGLSGVSSLNKLEDFVHFDREVLAKNPSLAFPKALEDDVQSNALSERESMQMLKDYGIKGVSVARLARSLEEARSFADDFVYPLVAKVSSAQIMHKSDVGGVKLNIKNKAELEIAYNEIMASCQKACPDAIIDGVIVNTMHPKGVEMIIGMNNDSQFGPMMMLGMGGVFVELFKDVALAPAPLSKPEALKMLTSLKAYSLLTGYRGSEPCDVDALVELLCELSKFAAEHKDSIKEFDFNPVFVYGKAKGTAIADALIVKV